MTDEEQPASAERGTDEQVDEPTRPMDMSELFDDDEEE